MDRNQFIGLILMFGLLAVYFTWFAPDPPPPLDDSIVEETAPSDSSSTLLSSDSSVAEQIPDSLQNELNIQKYGSFAFAAEANIEEEILENDELKVVFTNKGGLIKKVELKKHKDYMGNPLVIMSDTKSNLDLLIDHNGKKINLRELAFKGTIESLSGDTTSLSYTLNGGNFSLKQTYIMPPAGFQIGYRIEGSGLNTVLNPTDIVFNWNHGVNRVERNLDDSRLNSNVRYYLADGDVDELSERSNDYEEETLGSQIKWASFKQKFFTAAIIADASFKSGYINQKVDLADTSTVKTMSMQMLIPYADFANGFSATYYFGTTNYSTLKKVTPEFEENLDMGWGPLPLVNKFLIIPIFHFLEGFLTNYGIIILIIVVVIRLILSPLTWKSHMSMAKMRVMKPELDEIKARHDGDMQKAQQEQMKLYQQVGINPLSGCVPMLLQMPILFSLFFFFPNAVELRQQAFLWANDLSTYDSIIMLPFSIPFYGNHVSLFTLLMTLSTILYTWSNSQITTVQGPMKTLQYMMPIMFLFVLNSYASGLTFYYFVSNMVTFGQAVLFRKIIDEDKIHSLLQENKKKNANKKKSKFQTRLEDAMKASQEAQRQKKKKK